MPALPLFGRSAQQRGRKEYEDLGGILQLFYRHVLVIGVRDHDVAGTEHDRGDVGMRVDRRYMEDVLERYVNLSLRNGSSVSAIMIALDHFKRFNDEHGHAVGDSILRETAAAIVGALRPSDVACRYGGEELVVLLPDCPVTEAVAKAETLRTRIEAISQPHGTRVTASFGVATIPETSSDAGNVLAMADEALYRAKQGGRNQVAAAPHRPGLSAVRPAQAAE